MSSVKVAAFVDYENLRRGLQRHFQQDIPKDIPVCDFLRATRVIVEQVGTLYECFVFGDWTLRPDDAKEISRTPHFKLELAMRSDSKKDRTDPVMNFAIDDFYRNEPVVNDIVIFAGDSDYCEVVRRGIKLSRNIYVSAVAAQTAPELIALTKAFYPIEHALGLKYRDPKAVAEAIASLDAKEVARWRPLVRQLLQAEQSLPYVVRNYFIRQFMAPGLGYGDTFEQKAMTLESASAIGLVEFGRIPNPKGLGSVTTLELVRTNQLVQAIVAEQRADDP